MPISCPFAAMRISFSDTFLPSTQRCISFPRAKPFDVTGEKRNGDRAADWNFKLGRRDMMRWETEDGGVTEGRLVST